MQTNAAPSLSRNWSNCWPGWRRDLALVEGFQAGTGAQAGGAPAGPRRGRRAFAERDDIVAVARATKPIAATIPVLRCSTTSPRWPTSSSATANSRSDHALLRTSPRTTACRRPSAAEVRHVPLTAAAGRALAQAQTSTVDVPPLDNSAMDGYAVRLGDLPQAGVTPPVSQRIPAGSASNCSPAAPPHLHRRPGAGRRRCGDHAGVPLRRRRRRRHPQPPAAPRREHLPARRRTSPPAGCPLAGIRFSAREIARLSYLGWPA